MLEFYKFILRKTTVFKNIVFFTIFTLANLVINILIRNIFMLVSIALCLYGINLYIENYYDYRKIWIDKIEKPIIVETYRIVDGKETIVKTDKIGKNHPKILKATFLMFAGFMIGFNLYISIFAK